MSSLPHSNVKFPKLYCFEPLPTRALEREREAAGAHLAVTQMVDKQRVAHAARYAKLLSVLPLAPSCSLLLSLAVSCATRRLLTDAVQQPCTPAVNAFTQR